MIDPIVKSKSIVNIPDGIYAGKISGWTLTILSQDQFNKQIPLEFGVKTMNLIVVVLIKDSIAYCFDKGFK